MNTRTRKIIRLILKSVALLLVICTLVYIAHKYGVAITRLAKNPAQLKELLSLYGKISIAVFIGLQVLQVVVATIPGELVQIAGGYIYGAILGTLYSIVGISLGSIVAFLLARVFGFALLSEFIPKKSIEKYRFLMNSPKSVKIILLLFLIPGLPKDIFNYIAGLTPVNSLLFFILSSTARIPALFVSCYIGANLRKGNYLLAAILSVLACLFLVISMLRKDRIVKYLQHFISPKNDGKGESSGDREDRILGGGEVNE